MRYRLRTSAILLVLSFIGVSTVHGQTAESAGRYLEGKGLEKTGRSYVLANEESFTDAMREATALRSKVTKAAKARSVVEQQQFAAESAIKQMFQMRSKLRTQLNETSNVKTHNRIVTQINDLGDRIVIVQEGKELKQQLSQTRGGYNTAREAYVGKLLEVRQLFDTLNDEYEALNADPKVQLAQEVISKADDTKVSVCPSSGFRSALRSLKRLEDNVISEKIALRRGESDLHYVPVTFNGEHTEELAIDTGASIIALPYSVAVRVGLTPSSDDLTIQVELADGRVIEAKQVFAETVRVGKFTVKNVECSVFPEELKKASALLGMSFLRNFSYKINSENNELIMNKVESGTR